MPGVRVGRHARIRRAIIDRDVFIPRGALIGYNPEEDRKRHTVTESGIVVVTTDDEPFVGEIAEESSQRGEFDREAERVMPVIERVRHQSLPWPRPGSACCPSFAQRRVTQ